MTKHSENTKPSNSTKPVLENRLLIFRAWVKKQNRMIEVYGFNEHLVFEQTLDSPSIKENIFEIADCHIIQFTGLKDNKERMIFDFDIIYSNYHSKLMIIFFGKDLRYRLSDNLIDLEGNSYVVNETVIEEGFVKKGNIFENIELMQTTSYAVC